MKKIIFCSLFPFKLIFPLFLLFISVGLAGQGKTPISRAEELPRRTYALTGKVSAVYQDDEQIRNMADYAYQVLSADLEQFDIQDKSTLAGYHSILMLAEFSKGLYPDVLKRLEALKQLEDKEEERATIGLTMSAVIRAIKTAGAGSGPAFESAFKREYAANLDAGNPDYMRRYAEQTRVGLSLLDPEKSLAGLDVQLQPFLDNGNGQVPESIAFSIMASRVGLDFRLGIKAPALEILDGWLAAHPQAEDQVKGDFWEERAAAPSGTGSEVVVAVWDTGVDPKPFGSQFWVNPNEIPGNQKDDDGNGFIDDVNGIAFDLDNKRSLGPLLEQRALIYPVADLQRWSKGAMDLQSGIRSAEGAAFQEKYMSLKPEEAVPFQEDLTWYGTFAHGTHVAGIVAAGNPSVRIMYARLSYDTKVTPRPYTDETQSNLVQMYQDAVAYFKTHGVRVVNMSWRYNADSYENVLNLYGIGKDEQERKAIARRWFEAEKSALAEAMRSAPEILFICGSGNENNDAGFAEYIPAGIDLPNLITIGAVDDKGMRTSFTTEGASVDFYANGFEVESFVPGGDRLKFSGTSMASPQVANLAARLLAINPQFSPREIVDMIRATATPDLENKGILLIHPRNAVQKALRMPEDGGR